MCSYTIKGGNYRTNGFDEKDIKQYYESSFQKQSQRDISKDIFAYLDTTLKYNPHNDYDLKHDEMSKCFYPETNSLNFFKKIQETIIRYIITEEIQIGTPKPFVSRHAYLWIQNTKTIDKVYKIKILCQLII